MQRQQPCRHGAGYGLSHCDGHHDTRAGDSQAVGGEPLWDGEGEGDEAVGWSGDRLQPNLEPLQDGGAGGRSDAETYTAVSM